MQWLQREKSKGDDEDASENGENGENDKFDL